MSVKGGSIGSIEEALKLAVGDGVISAEQAQRLGPYLDASRDAARVIARADALEAEESEQPRFIRGFHDILITIGVIVALIGLWGLGSIFLVLPAIIVLAEILVRRQRLALPAVALTVALIQWGGVVAALVARKMPDDLDAFTQALVILPIFSALLAAFYWRYKVPLSLAAMVVTLFVLAADIIFLLLAKVTGSANFIAEHATWSSVVFLAGAFGIFCAAMRYDISDPMRQSRRSDIAFWLHLAAAPALLYAMLSFVFLRGGSAQWWGDATSRGDAAAVVAIVVIFMAVGLIIDRRAFVTSGLISLGLAIWTLLSRGGISLGDYFSVTVLAVGLVVLAIGIFWQTLRRAIISLLPLAVTGRLHPVRHAAA